MLGSSCSGVLACSGVGRAALGKRDRKVEVGNSRGASQPAVASGGSAQPALQELVDEIIQLGHMPTQSKNAGIAEKRLARRLIYVRNGIRRAGKAKKLSPEQEAELEALQQEPRDVRAQGGDTGTAIRRRPAARNAEEDRRLSRRTDAS